MYSIHLESLHDSHTRYESFVNQMQQATKYDSDVAVTIRKDGEGMTGHSKQMPSMFFEDILKELEVKLNNLTEKIENSK